MIILKKWIRGFLSFFVFLKYRNIRILYEHLYKNNLLSGVCASVFTHYCDSHGAYIGIGAEFKAWPYFPHGLSGVFISDGAKIGKNCVIFQHVTIGSSITEGSDHNGVPVIGDNCYIGSGAKIIGNVTVGNNCRIGANAVVYEDVPDNCVVVPSKTRIMRKEEKLDNRFIKNVKGTRYYYDFDTCEFRKL